MSISDLIEKGIDNPIEREKLNDLFDELVDSWQLLIADYLILFNVPVRHMKDDQFKQVTESGLFNQINYVNKNNFQFMSYVVSKYSSSYHSVEFQKKRKECHIDIFRDYIKIKGDVFEAYSNHLKGTKGLMSVNRDWFVSLYSLSGAISLVDCIDQNFHDKLHFLFSQLNGFMTHLINNEHSLMLEAKSEEDLQNCKIYTQYARELYPDLSMVSNVVSDILITKEMKDECPKSFQIIQNIDFLFKTDSVLC